MRLVIADDHALFRESLRSLLEARDHEVVGEAGNGREAVALCESLQPDILLLDLSMPEQSGLETLPLVQERTPKVRVVVLTASDDDDDLLTALRLGARGFLSKNLDSDRFFGLLDAVLAGDHALTPELSQRVLRSLSKGERDDHGESENPDALTQRELEVLEAMVDGITSNRRLAAHLRVSENTVKFHVRNILEKLQLHSRAQAISYAVRKGVVEPEG